ncbi:hypothetical protein DIE21_15490 [Burkholderia sp. Bp9140]|uniref:hypothetical protein n=1 Tax=Burkholderia sp. Bp9140 TaxID=2184572 RepID=UPI000F55A2E4|nr:hypothetical protein [Burkholderia sp. Bp9140]RQR51320.1 hypothetical protein DIE21_15490 [Burkholderia sp. Bp9140]
MDMAFIRNLVRKTCTDSFKTTHGDGAGQRKIGALAIAIGAHGRMIASLNVIYLERTINPAEATGFVCLLKRRNQPAQEKKRAGHLP